MVLITVIAFGDTAFLTKDMFLKERIFSKNGKTGD